MHFGTFKLTDEGIDDPPRASREPCEAAGLAPTAFLVPGSANRSSPDARRGLRQVVDEYVRHRNGTQSRSCASVGQALNGVERLA